MNNALKLMLYLLVLTVFCIDSWVSNNKLNLVISSIGLGATLRNIFIYVFGDKNDH